MIFVQHCCNMALELREWAKLPPRACVCVCVWGGGLNYSDPENQMFNLDISDISVALRETTRTISDSI